MNSQQSFFLTYNAQPRQRRPDPFACPKKIAELLEKLIHNTDLTTYVSTEKIRQNNYETLIHLLQRGANYLRSKGNSKPNSKNETIPQPVLLEIVNVMSKILEEESQKRISFRTFTDNYLRVLFCPDDIKKWLSDGQISLFEALQLKRLSSENLAVSLEEALLTRSKFFNQCREEKWIIQRLRYEIDLKLGKRPCLENTNFSSELKDIKAQDCPSFFPDETLVPTINPNSFFNEQIFSMIEMINSIDFGELEKKEQEILLTSVDNVVLQIQKILKKQQRVTKRPKLESSNLGFL